jgi:signal transduction histidine kinase
MFETLRSRLLAILLAFAFSIIIVSVVSFRFFVYTKDSLSEVTEKIKNTHVLLLKDIKVLHDFFENETINSKYFETGQSDLLNLHEKLSEKINQSLNDLYDLQRLNNFHLQDSISKFKTNFNKYNQLTSTIIHQITKRGFKDYGTEGKMRDYAHTLETHSVEIGLVNVLQLRRHEKDFIIRQENSYVQKFEQKLGSIRETISSNRRIAERRKSDLLYLLDNYASQFKNLVYYEKQLGLKNSSGIKKQIDDLSNRMEMSLTFMVEYSKLTEAALLNSISWVFAILSFVFILASMSFAVVISKRILRKVTYLKERIDEFVKSDFTIRTILPMKDSANEIDILATNFSIMEQHLVDQMNSLKQTKKDLEMVFYATSHEIQAPLITVKRLTDIAVAKTTEPKAKDFLKQINNCWQSLVNIIDELGIVTNVRNAEIDSELINLEELLKNVFAEFKSLPWFDNIIFSMQIKLQRKFYSSPGLIKAIFRNLIENGIKYATKRATFSFLKISITDQNDEMIRIEVSDNGIGIKKEYQDKIFDMFYRGTSYTSGTGLGLYIVQCSLDKLNGAISVDSDEDKGTTFTLLIPNKYNKKSIKELILHKRIMAGISGDVSVQPT